MAASVYATPPPDLIGEDTAGLSDSSNSSTQLPVATTAATDLTTAAPSLDHDQPLDTTGK